MNKYQKEIEKLIDDKYRLHASRLEKEYDILRNNIMIDLQDYMMQNDAIGINYSQMMQYDRLKSLMGQIDNEVNRLDGSVYENISKYASVTGDMSFNELFYDYEQQLGREISFNLLPKDTLETIVNMKVNGIKLSDRLTDGNIAELKGNMIATLFEGFGKGSSYQKMASRLSEVSGASLRRSLNIMRTEGGRVQAISHERSQNLAKEKGVEFDKIWIGTLDGATRTSHRRLDSQKADKDGYFHSNGHKALQPHLFGVAEEDINCRCRTFAQLKLPRDISRMNALTRIDNETGEVIRYNNYEGWMRGKGLDIDGNPLKREKDIKIVSNMLDAVGASNYNKFHVSLNGLPNGLIKDVFAKFGSEVEFERMGKRKGNFATGHWVNLNQLAFDGASHKVAMETVYHEMGHALDYLAKSKIYGKAPIPSGTTTRRKALGRMRTFDEYVTHLSSHPDYKLNQTIKDELWRKINGDLMSFDALGKKPRKKSEKELWQKEYSRIFQANQENIAKFVKDMKSKHSVKELAALSDMLESTGWSYEYPMGSGHGASYWKSYGTAEAEFFAHATEIIVNTGSGEVFKDVFPESLKIYDKMLRDMLKGG